MNVAHLAAQISATLAPYLPTLLKGVEKVAEEGISRLWDKLADAFRTDDGLKGVGGIAGSTSPKLVEAALTENLERYLKMHPELAAALQGDPVIGTFIMRAQSGGKIKFSRQLQDGVAANMEMIADGADSEIIGSSSTAIGPKAK